MKIHLECIPCIVNHASSLAGKILPQEKQEAAIREILQRVSSEDWNISPPIFARNIFDMLCPDNSQDLFKTIKVESSRIARELLPRLREKVNRMNPDEAFIAKVKLAIGGNIIDFGAIPNFSLDTVADRMSEVFQMPIDETKAWNLRRKMQEAKKIFYILDNCGEAVFDQLLLELIADKVTLGVRGKPVLNDVTEAELSMSGLASYPFISSGDSTPGVSLQDATEAYRQMFETADLVIAKGQGNFETLSDAGRPIYFLLRAKCPVVARELHAETLGELHIGEKL